MTPTHFQLVPEERSHVLVCLSRIDTARLCWVSGGVVGSGKARNICDKLFDGLDSALVAAGAVNAYCTWGKLCYGTLELAGDADPYAIGGGWNPDPDRLVVVNTCGSEKPEVLVSMPVVHFRMLDCLLSAVKCPDEASYYAYPWRVFHAFKEARSGANWDNFVQNLVLARGMYMLKSEEG